MRLSLPAPVRRGAIITLIVLAFLALVGATYTGVNTALERRRLPYPGRLVDVGGHQLHIHCLGKGSPVVVLEAPATGMSSAWGWVQRDLASTTRVCSYDRAGLGWSEAGDGRYDPQRVPDDLHTLLGNAHERGPYIVAGQGLGAAFTRLFASRYRADTAALVLIDADTPADDGETRTLTRMIRMAPWVARLGLSRATDWLSKNATGLPGDDSRRMRAFLNRPDHLARSAQELARWKAAVELAATAPIDPALPIDNLNAEGRGRLGYLTTAAAGAHVADAIAKRVALMRSAADARHAVR